ncbi:hypothetical protein BIU82_11885 [Arthrobacter sp. SW1]|nr:hypothetical protein BIU82_11885 [Arthrobacter sp. SW1]
MPDRHLRRGSVLPGGFPGEAADDGGKPLCGARTFRVGTFPAGGVRGPVAFGVRHSVAFGHTGTVPPSHPGPHGGLGTHGRSGVGHSNSGPAGPAAGPQAARTHAAQAHLAGRHAAGGPEHSAALGA